MTIKTALIGCRDGCTRREELFNLLIVHLKEQTELFSLEERIYVYLKCAVVVFPCVKDLSKSVEELDVLENLTRFGDSL